MEEVRKLLGWGQSLEKDEALTIASTHKPWKGMKGFLSAEWLDDNEVGWLTLVVNPMNILDLSDRLRNSKRTAHLILHHHSALSECGPAIRNDKRFWLSALACPSYEIHGHFYNMVGPELRNDPAVNMAWYNGYVVQKRQDFQVNYGSHSSTQTLELHLQDIKLKMQLHTELMDPLQAKYETIQTLLQNKQKISVDGIQVWPIRKRKYEEATI